MSIIIRLQGLPLEANSVDVRLYFLGLTIPDGGVHIIGGVEGTVFIEFASDEDARYAMSRGVGVIKNSNVKILLSSRSEMQSFIDSVHQKYQLQQQQQNQPPQQQPTPHQPFQLPMLLSQVPWFNPAEPQTVPLQPWAQPNQLTQLHPQTQASLLHSNQTFQSHDQQLQQQTQLPQDLQPNQNNNRARAMSGMRGGDDKLFSDKRCVLSASNIPYRATSRDIIEFLSDFDIKEECIRRRYNQKGQPTADAKIAFPSHDAAMKALKTMNKQTICGRPVFLKPV